MTLTKNMAVKKALIALAIAGISQAYAAPPVTNYEYDANGNNTKVTDGLNNATTQEYDAVDRLKKQSQPHPTSTGQLGQINQTYNALDALTGVTDPRNLATTYTKDAYGRVLTQTSPDTGTTTYTYDNAGNLLTKTDARGAVATYTYDTLNRLKTVTYKPSATGTADETINFTYDAGTNGKGKLTGMTDSIGRMSLEYNAKGQVTRKQQTTSARGFDTQWQYDDAGRLIRQIYTSSRYIDYGYNTNGQVNQIAVDGVVMVSGITYHPNGLVKSYTWGNSKSYTQSVDSSGRPTAMTLGSELLRITYDDAGRITQTYRALPATPNTAISGSVSTYNYDNLARLTSQVTTATNTGYQYDLNGNRTNLTIGANSYPYGIDTGSNKLLSEAGPTATSYTYDALGNITGNGQYTYSYYSSGRLKEIKQTSTSTSLFVPRYNGLGQMVYRSLDYRYYVYDLNDRMIGEYDGNGDVIQETVYLGDTPIMTLRPDGLIRTADNSGNVSSSVGVSITGTWPSATALQGLYGGSYLTHAAAASTADKVTYTFTPTATQSFKIYARWVTQSTNATNATYTITPNTAGSTPTSITVDQTKNGGTWNYLGTYSLNTANQMTVALSGQGNGIVIADAIRFVPDGASNVQNNTFFVHTDHLNTPRLVANYNNTKRWTWYPESSEAFGANTPNENPASAGTFVYNFRFPGQLYIPAVQLSYNYYRDYNPRTGRYIESDPIGLDAGQMSTYSYVDGNPLNFIDPRGTDKTVLFNTTGGRSIFNLPTNGNWGGLCWSGGANSCGHPMGTLPPTDSADACYMKHDYCYDSCDKNKDVCQDKNSCRKSCDLKLYSCLKDLPDDPRAWPSPPRPGTEKDTLGYRRDAIYHYRPRNIFTE